MNAQGFTAEGLSLATTVLLLFPMLYFLFASLTFFLRPLGDPVVGRMLRGLFGAYFLAVTVMGALATLAFMATRHHQVAASLALLTACALAARAWSTGRVDAVLRAPGVDAARRLRRLQLAGMAYNATQIVLIIASIPRIFPAA